MTDNVETVIYKTVMDRIADGEISPGEWLREADIAAACNSSRTPVRAALRQLAAEGIIQFIPNRGARVRVWNLDELEKTYRLRAMLEGLAVREAAISRTEEEVIELEILSAEFSRLVHEKPNDWIQRASVANDKLHKLIISCARFPLIDSFVRSLHSVSFVRKSFHGYSDIEVKKSAKFHEEIVEAIKSGRSELGESLMRAHILTAVPAAIKAWRQPDGQE